MEALLPAFLIDPETRGPDKQRKKTTFAIQTGRHIPTRRQMFRQNTHAWPTCIHGRWAPVLGRSKYGKTDNKIGATLPRKPVEFSAISLTAGKCYSSVYTNTHTSPRSRPKQEICKLVKPEIATAYFFR